MKKESIILFLFFVFSVHSFSQKFELGDCLTPNIIEDSLLDYSPSTGVFTYQYLGAKDWYLFDRRISEVLVGVKEGKIVTTIYNLIPENKYEEVPNTTLALAQKKLCVPFVELRYKEYAVNIDDTIISISRNKNLLTFNKDRLVYYTTIKYTLLKE
jgi:hypothetical protein